jgi:hypothetical protein
VSLLPNLSVQLAFGCGSESAFLGEALLLWVKKVNQVHQSYLQIDQTRMPSRKYSQFRNAVGQADEPVGKLGVRFQSLAEFRIPHAIIFAALYYKLSDGPLVAAKQLEMSIRVTVAVQDGADAGEQRYNLTIGFFVAEIKEKDAAPENLDPSQVLGEYVQSAADCVLPVMGRSEIDPQEGAVDNIEKSGLEVERSPE